MNLDLKKIIQDDYYELNLDLEQIAYVQKRFSELFAFENLDVLLNDREMVTEAFVIQKLLHEKRGGVCYELNGLLYIVLRELGFTTQIAVATVWDPSGWMLDKTHTILLYEREDGLYLIDSGSGNNLTLQPVKIDGKPVTSPAGTYRVKTKLTDRGTVLCERKVGAEWIYRYAFYLDIVGWQDLQRIKRLIHDHPESPFINDYLVARTLYDGTVSITSERFSRKWTTGKEEKIIFTSNEEALSKLRTYSTNSVCEAVKQYIKKQNNI